MAEIEEESPARTDETTPMLSGLSSSPATARRVHMKVPEVEVHLYKLGKGPIDIFKAKLGGWEQDQLEVGDILEKYGLKSVYAFTPGSGRRGAPIRFRNDRSLLSYKDGAVLYLDGQPKDSLIKPVTKIPSGVTFLTIMIVFLIKEAPTGWASKLNMSGGSIPPWVVACVVIVFARLRKRTRNFFKKGRTQKGREPGIFSKRAVLKRANVPQSQGFAYFQQIGLIIPSLRQHLTDPIIGFL